MDSRCGDVHTLQSGGIALKDAPRNEELVIVHPGVIGGGTKAILSLALCHLAGPRKSLAFVLLELRPSFALQLACCLFESAVVNLWREVRRNDIAELGVFER
jgi:hypothetical protein